MSIKKPSNLVGIKEENQIFQINEKPKNPGQQKREKMRGKPILDSMANL